MALDYIKISCSSDSLAVVLAVFKTRPYIQVTMVAEPGNTFFAFVFKADQQLLISFAERNHFRYEILSEAKMQGQVHHSILEVNGDRSLAPWLHR